MLPGRHSELHCQQATHQNPAEKIEEYQGSMKDNEEYVEDVPQHFYESFCKDRKKKHKLCQP